MKIRETIPVSPIRAQQTLRTDEKRVLTSSRGGRCVPLCYVPLFREDRVARSSCRVKVDMAETAEMLVNAVNVTVFAHFVPYLAFDRFQGMDDLNRSYMGQPELAGHVIDFIQSVPFDDSWNIYRAMGLHAGGEANLAVVEAYNAIINFRRKARSKHLPLRHMHDPTLAEAFWHHTSFAHIVPDYDAAMIDGEVALQINQSKLPVSGIGKVRTGGVADDVNVSVRNSLGEPEEYALAGRNYASGPTDETAFRADPSGVFWDIYAELQDEGVTLSLSNIEVAKKTAAFAKLRQQYSGIDEEHIVDLLMQSVRVPEAALSQPILLDRKTTIIGYNRRYATDAANLSESVTSGETFVDLNIRTPAMNTGGIIMITAEIVPEQLFERQRDYFFTATKVDDFPNFTRDYLDPEKVEVVRNDHVDVFHSDPDGIFGYAPLNAKWKRSLVNVGGKFYRRSTDAGFDEDRQRIWAVEQVDPTLTEDFYLATNLHHKVFADRNTDMFEYIVRGNFDIVGNTVFGKGLSEESDAYQKTMEEVDTSIAKEEE